MDLVTRLKRYIAAQGIAVTQFADTCGIPRPTMSQLLNGRNKKVSDDLIRKIHVSYPDLSMLWLMFGEGEMLRGGMSDLSTSDHTYSSPKIEADIATDDADMAEGISMTDDPDADGFTASVAQTTMSIDFGHSALDQADEVDARTSHDIDVENDEQTIDSECENTDMDAGTLLREKLSGSQSSCGKGGKRYITNIIVYYSDNSFEMFDPRNS